VMYFTVMYSVIQCSVRWPSGSKLVLSILSYLDLCCPLDVEASQVESRRVESGRSEGMINVMVVLLFVCLFVCLFVLFVLFGLVWFGLVER
jgi:hypothetical protein